MIDYADVMFFKIFTQISIEYVAILLHYLEFGVF